MHLYDRRYELTTQMVRDMDIFKELASKDFPYVFEGKRIKTFGYVSNRELIFEFNTGEVALYDTFYRTCVTGKSIDDLEDKLRYDDEENWTMEFSKRLYKALFEKGITQNRLCTLTGISAGAMNCYMNGKRTPSSYKLSKICDVLGVSPNELVGF